MVCLMLWGYYLRGYWFAVWGRHVGDYSFGATDGFGIDVVVLLL